MRDPPAATVRRSRPAIVYATRPGGTTIDRDWHGGNPFATALIRATTTERVPFPALPRRLRELTVAGSGGHQEPQWTAWPRRRDWSFRAPSGARHERRCALVLVVSDYSGAGMESLAGAVHDERRLAAMLARSGFVVAAGIAPRRADLLAALTAFRRRAAKSDVAVIYCTGHGMEANGRTHLLPGDFRLQDGPVAPRLRTQAISVDRIAAACRAASLNLVFFAGCRAPPPRAGAAGVAP